MMETIPVPERSHEWPVKRLRFSIISNPVRSEVADRPEDDLVSFVPMEAVGEFGELDASQERQIADVYTGYTYFAEGDVVVAKITPCFENGKGAIATGLCNGVGFGTTELHVLRPEVGISNRWLYYLTVSEPFRRIGESELLGAGGQKRVPEDFIKDFRVGVPEFEQQEQIADFLDRKTAQIDSLIAKKRVLIERLKEKRLAVITKAVTKGLNEDVALRDSGIPWLGSIPEHWDVKRLKFTGEAIIGLTYDPDDLVDEANGVQVLRANNIRDGRLIPSESVYVSSSIPEQLELRIGDILVCSRNGSRALIGKCGRVTAEFAGATFGAFNTIFRGDNSDFVYYVFNSLLFVHQSGSFLTSTINQLTIGNFNSMVLPCPPEPECREIADYLDAAVEDLQRMIDKADEGVNRLVEYRSALITAAVTGKLNVHQLAIPATA